MDHIVTLDILLINSGQLPDSLAHTSLGMYLLLRATSTLAEKLHLISTSSLTGVASALNPLLPVAELTSFLRLHSPLVIVATAVAGFASILLLTRTKLASVVAVAVLGALLSQQWMAYHATLIRSELYAAFFWQLGILALAISITVRRPSAQIFFAAAGGALVGLGLITKFQLFPYLVAYLVFIKMAADLRKSEFASLSRTYDDYSRVFVGINVAALLIFCTLWFLAWRHQLWSGYFIVSNVAGEATEYGVNLFSVFFVATSLLLLALHGIRRRVTNIAQLISGSDLALLSTVQIGYGCAVFGGMLAFSDVRTSWSYTLANFKATFLRQFKGIGFTTTLDLVQTNTRGIVDHYPILFAVALFALCCIAAIALMLRDAEGRRRCLQLILWTCLVSCIFLLGSVFFRLIVRDMLWHEMLPTFMVVLTLCFIGSIIRCYWPSARGRHIATAATVVPLLLVIGANVAAYPTIALKADLNFNVYGWTPRHIFTHVYEGNQLLFRRIIQQRFTDDGIEPGSIGGIAFRQAVHWRDVFRTANFVLPYQSVPLTKIGVFTQGGSIMPDGPKLTSVPDEMRGALVVDLQGLRMRRIGAIDPTQVSGESEAFDKVTKVPAKGKMAIIPRADLDIFLFMPAGDLQSSCELTAQATQPGQMAADYCGRKITRYTDIPVTQQNPGFLTIRPIYGW